MKRLMVERDALKEDATQSGDPVLMAEYRQWRNWIKNNILGEKNDYYHNKFSSEKINTRKAWRIVRNILGQGESKSPNKIKFNDKFITNPRGLAEAFNCIFQEKIKKLRQNTDGHICKINPKARLQLWLENKDVSRFSLHPIDLPALRSVMKKIKPSRSHGSNFIDSSSIKLDFH